MGDPPEEYVGLSFNRGSALDSIFEEDLRLVIEPEIDTIEYHEEADEDMVLIRFVDEQREATAGLMLSETRMRELLDDIEDLLEEYADGG